MSHHSFSVDSRKTARHGFRQAAVQEEHHHDLCRSMLPQHRGQCGHHSPISGVASTRTRPESNYYRSTTDQCPENCLPTPRNNNLSLLGRHRLRPRLRSLPAHLRRLFQRLRPQASGPPSLGTVRRWHHHLRQRAEYHPDACRASDSGRGRRRPIDHDLCADSRPAAAERSWQGNECYFPDLANWDCDWADHGRRVCH